MKKRVLSSLSAGVGYSTAVFFAAGVNGIALSKTGYCRLVCRLSFPTTVVYERSGTEAPELHAG
ncbi:hypothetical protein [Paenibacillus kandeliae]|uniref:hypothetical protein n=1 Tax=Paenibacillus kandeliae TaxID=3231269 RepID=UPI003458A7E7